MERTERARSPWAWECSPEQRTPNANSMFVCESCFMWFHRHKPLCQSNIQTQTHIHTPTHPQESNPLRQVYLFALSPWKFTKDQTEARWTAFAFLLPRQSNNNGLQWCSKVAVWSKVPLCEVHGWDAVLRGGGGGAASTRPARGDVTPDPGAPPITA